MIRGRKIGIPTASVYLGDMFFGCILLAHWFGDFILQGTKMATLKGRRVDWLFLHVVVYALPLLAVALWIFPPAQASKFVLVNALGHLLTDAVSSRLSSRFRDRPRIFFIVIGTDQLLHLLLLYYSYLFFAEGPLLAGYMD